MMDIDEMNAGRELDALVAERVMGWARSGGNDHTSPAHKVRTIIEDGERWEEAYLDYDSKGPHDRLTDPEGHDIYLCGCREREGLLPYYSTDIETAWEVAAEMGRRGLWLTLQSDWHFGQFNAVLRRGKDYVAQSDMVDTAPLAICLAALRAVSP